MITCESTFTRLVQDDLQVAFNVKDNFTSTTCNWLVQDDFNFKLTPTAWYKIIISQYITNSFKLTDLSTFKTSITQLDFYSSMATNKWSFCIWINEFLSTLAHFKPAARVFYISFVFSNASRVLSQCNTRHRLLYLLNKKYNYIYIYLSINILRA